MAQTRSHSAITFTNGVAFIIAGAFAIALPLVYSLGKASHLSWLFILVGGVELLTAFFRERPDGSSITRALIGVIYLGMGIWFVVDKNIQWLTFTIALTAMFGVLGILFIVQGIESRKLCPVGVISLIFAGLVSFAVAGLMWLSYSEQITWLLGLLAGIQMIVYGLALMSFVTCARRLAR